MLDGIDEIDHTVRDQFCDQLLELAYKFPETLILQPAARTIALRRGMNSMWGMCWHST